MSENVKTVYNDSSLKISKIIGRLYSNSLTEEVFKEIATTCNFQKNLRILDIGCGNANAAIWFAKNYHVNVKGIDLSPSMVAQARENIEYEKLNDQIQISEMDFQSSFIEEKFDVIFAIDVAMYFENKKELYGKLRSFGSSGGWIVTTDYISKGGRPDLQANLISKWALAIPPTLDVLKNSILFNRVDIHKLQDASSWQLGHWEQVKNRVLECRAEIITAVGEDSYRAYLDAASQIISSINESAHGYVFTMLKI
ncbi:MAG: methyltransferase domain-containing protein [Bacteriovoracaceae bacterium]|nr:methyltransferase domain-containing protein [Bacteriovoracaceae bacterium]